MAIVGGTQLLLHPDQTVPMSMVGVSAISLELQQLTLGS